MKTYFETVAEKIKEKEKELGRELTGEEETEVKVRAMAELWVTASKELTEEENKSNPRQQ